MTKKSYLFAVVLFLSAIQIASADQILSVAVDTSSIAGMAGSIDFQFNPGTLMSQSATVTIYNFQGGVGSGNENIGDTTGGPVPQQIIINNTNADNENFEAFTFGTSISFSLDFSGDAVTSPNGQSTSSSVFAFSMFSDPAGFTPVLSTDPSGAAAEIMLNSDTGLLTPVSLSSAVQFTPEPASLVLLGGALAIFGGVARLRLKRPS